MRKLLFIALLLMAALAGYGTIHQVGGYNWEGEILMNHICLRGDLAYVTDNWTGSPTGLLILDISNPANPIPVGTGTESRSLYGIDVYNDRAYIAAGGIGFEVWDVSNPSAPVQLSIVNSGSCELLTAVDGRLYVPTTTYGLRIYDISQPTPVLLGTYDDVTANDVLVRDGLAYIACYDPGLLILDVSNPAVCVPVGSYDAYLMKTVRLQNDILFLSDGHTDQLLIDVSQPSNPVLIYEIPVIWIKESQFHHNYLFSMVATPGTGDKELRVYDIANPSQPVLYTICVLSRAATCIRISGNYMYVIAGSSGLLVFDISDLSNPLLISTSHIPGNAMNVELRGDFAYICDDESSLKQLNISQPENPRLVSQYTLTEYMPDMVLDGDLAYVTANTGGLKVFYLTEDDPPESNNFHLLATLDTGNNARQIVLDGDHAFLSNYDNLLTLDISEPSLPAITYTFTNGALLDYNYLEKFRNYLLITGWTDPISVLDVNDPDNPQLVAWINNPSLSNGIAILGNYVIQTCYQLPARIYDISNPISPVLVGTLPNPAAGYMLAFVYEGLVFTSCLETNTIRAYDIYSPGSPVLVWNYQWNLPTYDLVYRHGLLYACNGQFGFSIINCQAGSDADDPNIAPAELSLTCRPNPFSSEAVIDFKAPSSGSVEVLICNLKGQKVRRLYSGYAKAGDNSVCWDGTDEHGSPVANGIYLCRISSKKQSSVKRIIRMR